MYIERMSRDSNRISDTHTALDTTDWRKVAIRCMAMFSCYCASFSIHPYHILPLHLSLLHFASRRVSPTSCTMSPTDEVIEASAKLFPILNDKILSLNDKTYNENWAFEDLDNWRNSDLPTTLLARHKDHNLHITKHELRLLMDWKLAKGKFRPTLPKLINSNDEKSVEEVSRSALTDFVAKAEKLPEDVSFLDFSEIVNTLLKTLCELKGVGPATASLVLSLLREITKWAPPFFSDESFAFFIEKPLRPGLPIKYNFKEYVNEYVNVLFHISREVGSDMVLLERGGWALQMWLLHDITKFAGVENPLGAVSDAFADSGKYLMEIPKKAPKPRAPKSGKRKAETPASENKPKVLKKEVKSD